MKEGKGDLKRRFAFRKLHGTLQQSCELCHFYVRDVSNNIVCMSLQSVHAKVLSKADFF